MLRLEADGQFTRKTLMWGFQQPLKQFSKYLVGRREIPIDHLAAWPRINGGEPAKRRRALSPDEMVRALAAAETLDSLCCRNFPTRPVWLGLLITAPRISALANLDVADLDRGRSRLKYKGNMNKRAGAGALDDATLQDLIRYVGERQGGPLFLSPEGERLDRTNSLRTWRDAVSLAAVDMVWPNDQPRDLMLEYFVHLTLRGGRVRASLGGPDRGKHQPGEQKRKFQEAQRRKVKCLAARLRELWQEHMSGVDQHCLRMTHRTWALAAGVPEGLIDRQLGHTSPGADEVRAAAWSVVGRKYYTDQTMLTLDARRSAEAVRSILDRAEAEFRAVASAGETALVLDPRKARIQSA